MLLKNINLNLARQIHTTKPSVSPTMGMSMAGFRPLVSDQGPMKRQRMMPGIEERMDAYMVIVATSFWTSICSFWWALKLVHMAAE